MKWEELGAAKDENHRSRANWPTSPFSEYMSHTIYIYTHTYISPCVASYNYVTIIYEEAMQIKHMCVCVCVFRNP